MTPLQFLEYPISHSLVGMTIWALVGAAVYYSWPTRDTSRHWQAAALVGVAILSHFPLDLSWSTRPICRSGGEDSRKLGLGLWNNPTATLLLELATLAAGVAVYVGFRSRRHPGAAGAPRRPGAGARRGSISSASSDLLRRASRRSRWRTSLGLLLLAGFAAWADRRATPAELAAAGLPTR